MGAASLTRTRVVWVSLLIAMSSVTVILMALSGRPVPRLDGVSLPPLAAAGGIAPVESVFRTRAEIEDGRWLGIVVHHSGSPVGSPASIAAEHEALNFRGLGHHFVIGNGRGMDDGELHVGYRWLEQLPGAHAGGPRGDWHNLHSISICLVGDGNRRPFTVSQIRRLVQLVAALCRELEIPPENVLLHSEIAPASDPGVYFPAAAFRGQISSAQ